MSEWISVKDRMPEAGRDVLLYSHYWSSKPFVGCRLSMGAWEADRILSGEPEGDPTHWQPLPEPPAGQN